MAQQLRSAGEEVSRLVMIDCSAPGSGRSGLSTGAAILHMVRNLAHWVVDDDFFRDGLAIARGALGSKAMAWRTGLVTQTPRAKAAGPAERHRSWVWQYPDDARGFLEAFHRALTTYRPRAYPGTVTVIRSRTRKFVAFSPLKADLGWQKFAAGGVQARVLAGAHDTIIREPRVRKLAEVLNEFLDDVEVVA
jgi:thioesterase domain-containing protein